MAKNKELTPTEILIRLEKLEKIATKAYMSFTEAGSFLGKNPSVVSQYAKAGLIHPIQQGNCKLISMSEVRLLEVYMHAVQHYGYSYTGCKILGGLLTKLECNPNSYMDVLKEIEEKYLNEKDIVGHVNSYKSRGIFQKKKAKESRENIS